MQFESDEKKFQLEKYEAVLKEQQDTLVDSDNIIVQLNENLFLLKSQLAQQEHLKHSYESKNNLMLQDYLFYTILVRIGLLVLTCRGRGMQLVCRIHGTKCSCAENNTILTLTLIYRILLNDVERLFTLGRSG